MEARTLRTGWAQANHFCRADLARSSHRAGQLKIGATGFAVSRAALVHRPPPLSLTSDQLGQIDLRQLLLENLAGLELDDGALRNDHFGFWLVRIAADALLAHLHFQHSEVAQFD